MTARFPIDDPATMYRLVLLLSGETDQTIPLADNRPLTLGREDDNAIRLDDPTVSRNHARLSPTPEGRWVVEDLQSSNGIRINGVRCTRAELAAGDEVRFGEVAAIYREATPDERAQDAAQEARADPAVGRNFLGRYRLNVFLGDTPEYDFYRAADLAAAGRAVSLRIFRPEVIGAAGGVEAMTGRFAANRAAPAHANLAALLDFAGWRDAAYLAAGWAEGYPLLDILRHRGSLTVAEALRFARQAAAATTHARAHRLPPPDLHPRAVLLAFEAPLNPPGKPDAWPKLIGKPVGRWPAFTLKMTPGLNPPEAGYPFGALLCELLGAPSAPPPALRTAAARVVIPGLGEDGNTVLTRGLASRGEAFGGDAAFVEILARAADPRAYR